MNKTHSQAGTTANRATCIINLDVRRIRLVAGFRKIMVILPRIQTVRRPGRVVA